MIDKFNVIYISSILLKLWKEMIHRFVCL